MKRYNLPLLLVLLILAFPFHNTSAQYEQKFTLQLAGGYVEALYPESFTQYFHNGFSLDGGAQYNFNRTVSMVVLAKYSKFFAAPGFFFQNANYDLLGISLCPKYRFLVSRRVNPYLFGGVSLNYITFSFEHNNITQKIDSPTSFGITGGLGIDFRLTDNFAIFWQGGFNRVDQQTVDHNSVWIESFYSQAGVNISLFKSRSL
jgi:opacity protein-like surface antigen